MNRKVWVELQSLGTDIQMHIKMERSMHMPSLIRDTDKDRGSYLCSVGSTNVSLRIW